MANANRKAQLPATAVYRARLALTLIAEIDTRGECNVIRLISREINIEVSLDEVSCERRLPVRPKGKMWKPSKMISNKILV